MFFLGGVGIEICNDMYELSTCIRKNLAIWLGIGSIRFRSSPATRRSKKIRRQTWKNMEWHGNLKSGWAVQIYTYILYIYNCIYIYTYRMYIYCVSTCFNVILGIKHFFWMGQKLNMLMPPTRNFKASQSWNEMIGSCNRVGIGIGDAKCINRAP